MKAWATKSERGNQIVITLRHPNKADDLSRYEQAMLHDIAATILRNTTDNRVLVTADLVSVMSPSVNMREVCRMLRSLDLEVA